MNISEIEKILHKEMLYVLVSLIKDYDTEVKNCITFSDLISLAFTKGYFYKPRFFEETVITELKSIMGLDDKALAVYFLDKILDNYGHRKLNNLILEI